jgi:hypothetical protein
LQAVESLIAGKYPIAVVMIKEGEPGLEKYYVMVTHATRREDDS